MQRTFKDYFIILLKGIAMGAADVVPGVSGGTIAFISGIYQELVESISGIKPSLLKTWKKEGFGNSEWVILDYVNTVVHVFQEEARNFYNLDGLWADAKITKIKDL